MQDLNTFMLHYPLVKIVHLPNMHAKCFISSTFDCYIVYRQDLGLSSTTPCEVSDIKPKGNQSVIKGIIRRFNYKIICNMQIQ